MTYRDLDFLDEQVDRLADGMGVNRERLARDVKALTTEVRNWRRTWEAKKAVRPSTGKFSDAFAGLFPEKD